MLLNPLRAHAGHHQSEQRRAEGGKPWLQEIFTPKSSILSASFCSVTVGSGSDLRVCSRPKLWHRHVTMRTT